MRHQKGMTLIGLILFCVSVFAQSPKPSKFKIKKHKSVSQVKHSLEILAVGDIMPGTQFPSQKFLPNTVNGIPEGLSKINLSNYSDSFHKCLVFGNLEGVLTDSNFTSKKCADSSKCYAFKIPENYGLALSSIGFNLMSIANNHIADFGIGGINCTVNCLKRSNIHYAGVSSHPAEVFLWQGMRIGFTAFSFGPDCMNLNDSLKAIQVLAELHSFCDIIIVSMHSGAEGNAFTHVTKQTENYLDENRGNSFSFAHLCIDHGADLVLGHGPHVPRALEIYKDRLIAYSLGNFSTYKRFNLKKNNKIAPLLKVKLSSDGAINSAEIFSFVQKGEGITKPDFWNRAKRRMLTLSKQDFPENQDEILRKIKH